MELYGLTNGAFGIRHSVSSIVDPVATQPGKSGTYAENFAAASSIPIAYFIGVSITLEASSLKETDQGTG